MGPAARPNRMPVTVSKAADAAPVTGSVGPDSVGPDFSSDDGVPGFGIGKFGPGAPVIAAMLTVLVRGYELDRGILPFQILSFQQRVLQKHLCRCH